MYRFQGDDRGDDGGTEAKRISINKCCGDVKSRMGNRVNRYLPKVLSRVVHLNQDTHSHGCFCEP